MNGCPCRAAAASAAALEQVAQRHRETSFGSCTRANAGVSIDREPDVGADAEQHDADRKQARQPQARNASLRQQPGRARTHRRPGAARRARRCARSCRRTRASRGRVLDGEQHRAAVLAADADALQDPEHAPGRRRPDADLVVRRQQADRGGADAHDQQGQQQHLLAPDPVAEVAEDQPADRPGEEADGERGEGRELRGRSVEAVEVELVEDQPRRPCRRGRSRTTRWWRRRPARATRRGRSRRPPTCVRAASSRLVPGRAVSARVPRSTSAPLIRPSRWAGRGRRGAAWRSRSGGRPAGARRRRRRPRAGRAARWRGRRPRPRRGWCSRRSRRPRRAAPRRRR